MLDADRRRRKLQQDVSDYLDDRRRLVDGGVIGPSELVELADRWRPLTNGGDGDPGGELLDLVDADGTPTGTVAPRWLCHLLGLRHSCIHILLDWTNSTGTRVLLLQIRSMSKAVYPGYLDISVGGHVPAGVSAGAAARDEMHQELGLRVDHLQPPALTRVAGFESCTRRARNLSFDREWCEVFTGTVAGNHLEAVRFLDGEVAGLRLLPVSAAEGLLARRRWPLAPALAHSLRHCLPL